MEVLRQKATEPGHRIKYPEGPAFFVTLGLLEAKTRLGLLGCPFCFQRWFVSAGQKLEVVFEDFFEYFRGFGVVFSFRYEVSLG